MFTTDVLIVGAGPVGLALACELGLAGVDCLLIEKRDGSIPVPKMTSISGGSMEYCRRWGIARQVRTAVWSETHALDFVYLESLKGRELERVKVPSYATRKVDWSPEGWCHCPQIYFDPILARRVGELTHVTRCYDTALESFTADADGVTATFTDDSCARRTVRARFLVGCDGPASIVRETLGIGLGGLGRLANSANIFFRSPQLPHSHDHGWARFYRTIDESGCWAELLPIDGRELFRLAVFDDPQAVADPDGALRRMMGGAFPYEILSVAPWERRDFVADSYGRDRVFIAGDAAHQFSPTGGIGMHTGLEDAVNLAWKLAAALQGWGGAALLDSYETERRPIGHRNAAISTSTYRALVSIPPSGRNRDGQDWRADMQAYSLPDHLRSNYAYDTSPLIVPDGTPAPRRDGRTFVSSARPGERAPHVWLEADRIGGTASDAKLSEPCSTLDLVAGTGFTLFQLGDAAPDAAPFVDAARRRNVPLHVVAITEPEAVRLYDQPLVLLRPDFHVAWRGGRCPPDALAVIDRMRGSDITARSRAPAP